MKPQNVMTGLLVAAFGLLCAASPKIVDKRSDRGRIRVNIDAVAYAKKLISDGSVVADKKGAWSEHQPSAAEENEFIRRHGFREYAKWHLGIDESHAENTKGRYKFPYGDFKNVHRCALLAAATRAGQYGHYDIENAAKQLEKIIGASKVLGAH